MSLYYIKIGPGGTAPTTQPVPPDGITFDDQYRYHSFDDQPAMITVPNGSKHWFHHGERHRTTGPAIIWHDGTVEWWAKGFCHHSCKSFQSMAGLTDGEMAALILRYGEIK